MKIVEAKFEKSKAAKIREIIKEITGKEKAVFLESESERNSFYRECYRMKLKPSSSLVSGKGWQCFVKQ